MFVSKAPALSSNITLGLERLVRYKHSSLFESLESDEEKTFVNMVQLSVYYELLRTDLKSVAPYL